jgi:hypothetical protein
LRFLLCCCVLLPARVYACGVSGPDGVWSCSLEEHEEEERPRWTLSSTLLGTSTALRFGSLRAEQRRSAGLVSAAYAPTPRLTLQASIGASSRGQLRVEDQTYDMSLGPTAALGVSYVVLAGSPFLVLGGALSGVTMQTHARADLTAQERYTALDLRLSAALGVTLFDGLRAYLLGRVFGGPVFWRYQGEARTGTDVSHYQLGLGVSGVLAERVLLAIEGVPLGERSLSGSAGLIF